MGEYYFIEKQWDVITHARPKYQALKLKASTMDSKQVIPLHIKQWM